MIYVHSLGRAARYYSGRTALAPGGTRLSFSELEDRVKGIAAALSAHGFNGGDRLALLLPNSPEYIELVYACSWLGVTAVPINTRLSQVEIDRILAATFCTQILSWVIVSASSVSGSKSS